ncbi:hypothetical protein MYU51_000675 [Penicillium brevicompactum]
MPSQAVLLEDWVNWAKVFRTLKFLECWFSFTLNVDIDIHNDETDLLDLLALVEPRIGNGSPVFFGTVHAQLSKIALMSAIANPHQLFDAKFSWKQVNELSEALDLWRQELPPGLSLHSLMSENDETQPHDRRALLLVHMLYLSFRLMPYERKMRQSGVADALSISDEALSLYSGFARQLMWIISLTQRDGLYVRCWLVM